MKTEEYDIHADIEKRHWWYRGRRLLLDELLKNIAPPDKSAVIFDLGCGVGSNIESLSKFGSVTGVDISEKAFEYCKGRGYAELLQRNIANPNALKAESADIAIACDLLEHIKDDGTAIAEIYKILKKNGILILTAPAFQFLWGGQDEAGRHFRRYQMKSLVQKLEGANFEIVKKSYFNFFLFFPILFVRLLFRSLRLTGSVSENKIIPVLNEIFAVLYKAEIKLLRRISFPFGVSILIVCKKV